MMPAGTPNPRPAPMPPELVRVIDALARLAARRQLARETHVPPAS
jgi:hypothetical protein